MNLQKNSSYIRDKQLQIENDMQVVFITNQKNKPLQLGSKGHNHAPCSSNH